MNNPRRLALKREVLAELSTSDLKAVVAGNAAIPTGKLTACLTDIIDPPSNTYVCTDTCFQKYA